MKESLKYLSITLFIIIVFNGCTRYYSMPVADYPIKKTEFIDIINSQSKNKNDIIFDNGIDITKTSYKDANSILISKIYNKLEQANIKSTSKKEIKISINSFMCGGYYVIDCTLSTLIILGNGKIKTINSEKRNGYPITSTFDKVWNEVAYKITTDEDILKYIIE